jgi:hypothetical protein
MPDVPLTTTLPAARGPGRRRRRRGLLVLLAALMLFGAAPLAPVALAGAAVTSGTAAASTSGGSGSALENAAAKASDTGRKVALSLIALAFAVAAIVLAFRRDFKEAAGVLVIGVIAVLLATPAGIILIQDTVTSVFGGG